VNKFFNRFSKKQWIIIVISILIVLNILGRASKNNSIDPSAIPNKFKSTYTELERRLNEFDARLSSTWDGKKHDVIFGAELLTANSHRGEGLLEPTSFQGNVVYLDALQKLGVQGVTIAVSYPLLQDDFPRSSEYLAFFKKVAQEVKRRGMTLNVESGIVFPQGEFTTLKVDYTGLTLDEYFKRQERMVEIIVREIHPDYLTIGNEPSTGTDLLGGQKITVERYTQYVRDVIDGLDKKGALIGAGAGDWDDTKYIEAFAKIPGLDYIDIHMYPLGSPQTDFLERAVQMAEIAQAHNKKLISSEMWLYKAMGSDVYANVAATPNIFGRDTFSFWAPLDQKWLDVMAKFANAYKFDYISPFWSKYFFAYLDYEQNKSKSANQLLGEADVQAVKNILSNTFSSTGLHYRSIIRGN